MSYMPLAANARELDELGSRNKPTSPRCRGVSGAVLRSEEVCCYERRGQRPPPPMRSPARDFPTALRSGRGKKHITLASDFCSSK